MPTFESPTIANRTGRDPGLGRMPDDLREIRELRQDIGRLTPSQRFSAAAEAWPLYGPERADEFRYVYRLSESALQRMPGMAPARHRRTREPSADPETEAKPDHVIDDMGRRPWRYW